jgi:predicted metal-binding membrane protein
MTDWREGIGGALAMGMRHGTFCVGCCWLIMALLFVAGVMNLMWVAILAGFVLLEKLLPQGAWVSRLAGLALVVWGLWLVGERFL